jgi:hypothetical protein
MPIIHGFVIKCKDFDIVASLPTSLCFLAHKIYILVSYHRIFVVYVVWFLAT